MKKRESEKERERERERGRGEREGGELYIKIIIRYKVYRLCLCSLIFKLL